MGITIILAVAIAKFCYSVLFTAFQLKRSYPMKRIHVWSSLILLPALSLALLSGCSDNKSNSVTQPEAKLERKLADGSGLFNGTFSHSMRLNINYDGRAPGAPVSTFVRTVELVQNGTNITGTVTEVSLAEDGSLFQGQPAEKYYGLKGTVLASGNEAFIPAAWLSSGGETCGIPDIHSFLDKAMALDEIQPDIPSMEQLMEHPDFSKTCSLTKDGFRCSTNIAGVDQVCISNPQHSDNDWECGPNPPLDTLPAGTVPERCDPNGNNFLETTATISADGNTLTIWGFEYTRQ